VERENLSWTDVRNWGLFLFNATLCDDGKRRLEKFTAAAVASTVCEGRGRH